MNNEKTRTDEAPVLKTEYREDAGHSYLIIDPEEELQTEGYFFLMVKENRIPGIVPFTVRHQDGKTLLFYDISHKRSLRDEYEKKRINDAALSELMAALCSCVETVRGFLLGAQRFLLEPEYVYFNIKNGELEFVCMPAGTDSTLSQAQRLAEFILQKLDHADASAVARGYCFYNEVCTPGCVLSQAARTALLEGCGSREPNMEAGIMREKSPGPEYRYARKTSRSRKSPDEAGFWCNPDEGNNMESVRGKRTSILSGRRLAFAVSALLLCGLCTIAYLEKYLDVTQFGGLCFLIVLGGGLICRRAPGSFFSKKEKKQRWLEEGGTDGAWMARMRERKRQLRNELYRDTYPEEYQEAYPREENSGTAPSVQDYPDSDTMILDGWEQEDSVLLEPEKNTSPQILLSRYKGSILIGREAGQADALIREDTVSRYHARLFLRGEDCFLVDLGSKNGTWVEEKRLRPQEEVKLEDGDRVRFGSAEYRCRLLMDEKTELILAEGRQKTEY